MGASALNFTKNDHRNLSHLVLNDLHPLAHPRKHLTLWSLLVVRGGREGITCTVSRGQGSCSLLPCIGQLLTIKNYQALSVSSAFVRNSDIASTCVVFYQLAKLYFSQSHEIGNMNPLLTDE